MVLENVTWFLHFFLMLCYYVVFALEGKVEFIHILLSTVIFGILKLGLPLPWLIFLRVSFEAMA